MRNRIQTNFNTLVKMIISNRKRTKGHPWIPTTMGEKAR